MKRDTYGTIPTGKVARTKILGVTAAKISAKKLGLLSKRPFLSGESFQRQQARNNDEIGDVLFQGLSRLRGSALKLAQMMSLESELLPEAYRKELYKSHYQVPPLNRAVVRRIMIGEFGKPPEELFKKFDATAFAAASLGQVHEAQSHSGERLAVKVQYPGIGSALKNDLYMVKQFLLPFFKTPYISDAMQEMDRRLSEEVDYDTERRNTQWFHDHAQMSGVLIPATFDAYSSSVVLTTEFVDGMHINQWLATNPSQEQRDHAAQYMYDFFMHSLFHFNRMHTDPNPGNYLFRNDGTIAVVDFGSVKVFTPELCGHIMEMWHGYIHGDIDKVISAYCFLGLSGGDRKLVEKYCNTRLALTFGEWIMALYQEDVFDFGKNAELSSAGAAIFLDLVTSKGMDGFTTETLMFDRTIYGLFRVFAQLGARVRLKNRWIY